MTLHWKLVIDAADPLAQADFWAEALGYLSEDNSALGSGTRKWPGWGRACCAT
ncbi:VOC family protein [Streptomyces formicae]|uniref:Glyoxalase-like domain-containing protein n=1 Tax=Streptomyces formicae TaxID=1616117 RepID=A0ABY3WW75_9ACTN|nr:hypothetical protein [Streptomyces formicae]UNM16904.1 hypothetical protein J4032_03475 [Streptomyces formicae]